MLQAMSRWPSASMLASVREIRVVRVASLARLVAVRTARSRIMSVAIAVCLLPLLFGLCAAQAQARVLEAKIAGITTGVASLQRIDVVLDWPAQAEQGRLRLRAAQVEMPDLGYRWRDVSWECPLRRDGAGGWRCEGDLRSGRAAPLRLAVDLGTAFTDLRLQQGQARIGVHRVAAAPDDTRIDLTRIPVLWVQALLGQAWADARLKSGVVDGELQLRASPNAPLEVAGPLRLSAVGLETPDASVAMENVGAHLNLKASIAARERRVRMTGDLRGGELLFGSAYVALPPTPVTLTVEGIGDASGWRLPMLAWGDGTTLRAQGKAAFANDGAFRALDLQLDSRDAAPLTARYLSGFLSTYGLSDLVLDGGMQARFMIDEGGLRAFEARFETLDVRDGGEVFRFDALDGDLHFSADAPRESRLRWAGGRLYGLDFGAADVPLRSADGAIVFREPVSFPAVGGHLRFDRFELRPRAGDRGLQSLFGLTLEDMDVGKLAQALGWPAFRGTLSGRIPDARYIDDRLSFEGGLDMQVFDGRVRMSSLAMERPFGVAPTLSADLELDDLDLRSVTEVFDFGSITGRLDGRIHGIRLVDWTATAFDAELHTDRAAARAKRERQRISQRAVQNISSVGDASFVTTLQGQLIALFDDFGYRRIGITCRLRNQVCAMDGLDSLEDFVALKDEDPSAAPAGLRSDNDGFTIVEGAGLPRLNVVGFKRRVDWSTLVERLAAIGQGDVKPVVE
jgi:hypothetical protein